MSLCFVLWLWICRILITLQKLWLLNIYSETKKSENFFDETKTIRKKQNEHMLLKIMHTPIMLKSWILSIQNCNSKILNPKIKIKQGCHQTIHLKFPKFSLTFSWHILFFSDQNYHTLNFSLHINSHKNKHTHTGLPPNYSLKTAIDRN